MTEKLIVHVFYIGYDVEDPVVYAAEPLIAWEKSEVGQWVVDHSMTIPAWHYSAPELSRMGYKFYITAELEEADAVFFKLKYT